MIFEVGKTYHHNAGETITIVGHLDTYSYGSNAMIAERHQASQWDGLFYAVGKDESATMNYTEIEDDRDHA